MEVLGKTSLQLIPIVLTCLTDCQTAPIFKQITNHQYSHLYRPFAEGKILGGHFNWLQIKQAGHKRDKLQKKHFS